MFAGCLCYGNDVVLLALCQSANNHAEDML